MIKFNYKLFFCIAILTLFSFQSFSEDVVVKNSFVSLGSNEASVEIKVYSSRIGISDIAVVDPQQPSLPSKPMAQVWSFPAETMMVWSCPSQS